MIHSRLAMCPASARVERLLDAAVLAHPSLEHVARSESFARHMEALTDELGGAPAHPGDLLVAYAAASGEVGAVGILEHTLREIPVQLARFRLNEPELRSVVQDLRSRLLLGTTEGDSSEKPKAKLLDYQGRGPLGAWVRVAAVRLVLTKLRTERRSRDDSFMDERLHVEDPSADPELAAAKRMYAGTLSEAFRAALRELSPRDRTVLRLYLVDGRNLDEIGTLFRVHRATIARWISDARAALGKRTQAIVTDRLDTNSGEFRSLTRLCYSQMDVSLHSLLASQENPTTSD